MLVNFTSSLSAYFSVMTSLLSLTLLRVSAVNQVSFLLQITGHHFREQLS